MMHTLLSAPRRPGWATLAGLLLAAACAGPSRAAEPGATVQSVRDWLYAHSPELAALRAEASAAEARVHPAGALPDPLLEVSLLGIDRRRPSLLPGNVGAVTYQLRQRFPLWGKRELGREIARQETAAARAEVDAMAHRLLSEAEAAYVRYWYSHASLRVIDRIIGLIDQIEAVATSRYALGLAAQQDAIRAQVERTTLQRDRIERTAMQAEAAAMLNGVLGRADDAPLAEPSEPPVLIVDAGIVQAARAALQRDAHPALQARRAMAFAAEHEVELARRERLPDVTVGVGAMQQGDRLDSYELMVEVEIPFQQRARRERERAARLRVEAAQARSHATRVDLQRQLGIAWARVRSAREQGRLIEATLLTQSEANFRSALASYQVGEVDFATLLDALRQWQGADLARLDAQRDEGTAAAEVRAVLGEMP